MSDFTIDDVVTSPDIGNAPASVRRITKFLDGMEHGKLMTRAKLSELVGIGYDVFQRCQAHPALEPYRQRILRNGARPYIFGSKATIADYRSWLASQEGKA